MKNCLHISCSYNKEIGGYRLLQCDVCHNVLRIDIEETGTWEEKYRIANREEIVKLIKSLK